MSKGFSFILFIATFWGLAQAQAPVPTKTEGSEPQSSNETVDKKNGARRSKAKKLERLDLNQVDLEQVEETWDSTAKKPFVDMNDTVKIKEIIELPGEYTYASFGKADPFIPTDFGLGQMPAKVDSFEQPAGAVGKEIQVVSPLQGYPLSDLTLKGMWQIESGETRAIILTPGNEGVVVKEGDPISAGKVLSIRRDSLMVRLYRLRTDGVRAYEDIAMKINTGEKKAKGVIKLEPGKDPIFLLPDGEPRLPTPLPETSAGLASPAAVKKDDINQGPNAMPPIPGAVPSAADNKGIQSVKDGVPVPIK